MYTLQVSSCVECLLACAIHAMRCRCNAFDTFAEASLVAMRVSCADAVHALLSRCSIRCCHKLLKKMTDHVHLLWLHQMPNHHLHPQPHLHTCKNWSAQSCLLQFAACCRTHNWRACPHAMMITTRYELSTRSGHMTTHWTHCISSCVKHMTSTTCNGMAHEA